MFETYRLGHSWVGWAAMPSPQVNLAAGLAAGVRGVVVLLVVVIWLLLLLLLLVVVVFCCLLLLCCFFE